MEDEFYATIKLTTGEEIVSKVCVSEENEDIILLLDCPVIMETILIRQLGMTTVRIHPWLKYSNESLCVIKMHNVITLSEIKDNELIKIYKKYIQEKDKKTKKTKITPNMGFISNISDARKTLERIYNSSQSI